MLSLTGLFKHLFRLEVHSVSFRRSVLGSTTAVFIYHISHGCSGRTLLDSARISYFFHSCTIDYTYFPVSIAVRSLLFGGIFAKFHDLGVVQVGDPVRFFADLVDLLRLAQVLDE